MRLIDADARVTVQSFDIEHEAFEHTEMSVSQALDFATDEGCPPVVEAIPAGWIENYMIAVKSCVRAQIVREMLEAWRKGEEKR